MAIKIATQDTSLSEKRRVAAMMSWEKRRKSSGNAIKSSKSKSNDPPPKKRRKINAGQRARKIEYTADERSSAAKLGWERRRKEQQEEAKAHADGGEKKRKDQSDIRRQYVILLCVHSHIANLQNAISDPPPLSNKPQSNKSGQPNSGGLVVAKNRNRKTIRKNSEEPRQSSDGNVGGTYLPLRVAVQMHRRMSSPPPRPLIPVAGGKSTRLP